MSVDVDVTESMAPFVTQWSRTEPKMGAGVNVGVGSAQKMRKDKDKDIRSTLTVLHRLMPVNLLISKVSSHFSRKQQDSIKAGVFQGRSGDLIII
jgi:hypothetical protein